MEECQAEQHVAQRVIGVKMRRNPEGIVKNKIIRDRYINYGPQSTNNPSGHTDKKQEIR